MDPGTVHNAEESTLMNNLIENLLSISDNAFVRILLVILLALVAQIIVKSLVKYLLAIPLSRSDSLPSHKRDREKRIRTLTGVATAAAVLGIWFIALLMILGILNVPIAPLLTSAGLIGAALAFGTQSLIRDFISGLFIIAENQYRVDDYIQLDKVSGKVEAITIRTTIVRADDGSLYHVPNGTIGVTANLSMGGLSARESLELAGDVSIEQFKKKLQKIAETIAANEEQSRIITSGPRFVGVTKISAKATTVTISFKTSPAKREKASSIVLESIRAAKIALN